MLKNRQVLLLPLVVLVAIGCSDRQSVIGPAPSGTLRIVSSLPSRGASAGQVSAIKSAIRLALSDRAMNADGISVEYVPLEGGSDETGEWSRALEQRNATVAANDPSVIAYIGPYNSGATAVSLPVTSRAGLLQAGISATWPGLTLPGWDSGEPEEYYPNGSRNFVRFIPPDSAQAVAAAMWAADLKITQVLVLDDGSSYSKGMADIFLSAAKQSDQISTVRQTVEPLGGIIFVEQLPGNTQTAVFYAPSSVGNAVLIARALGNSSRTVFATDTALDPTFLDQAGNAARNWLVLSNAGEPVSTTEFPGRNGASKFARNAYDLVNLILDGIAAGKHDRAAILDYVKSAKERASEPAGPLFDRNGDRTEWQISAYSWQEGRFKLAHVFASPKQR